MSEAYINRIATVVPPHDVHEAFLRFARALLPDARRRALFDRMAALSGIRHRFSVLPPSDQPDGDAVDAERFYPRERFPGTAERMRRFEREAPALATRAVEALELGERRLRISHLLVTTCTGLYAPGLDLELVSRCGLDPSIERTMVGFMGCYAAMNALKLGRHIVRSEPSATVLMVNLELCSLHLQQSQRVDQLLSFLVFGDGAAATLISARPAGLRLDRFHSAVLPGTRDLITWKIGDLGFDMVLSGQVPAAIHRGLEKAAGEILDGATPGQIDRFAVHPGGRSVLDAVEQGFGLAREKLSGSREILARYGNMSSASILFVLALELERARAGERGCALSFGPGLCAETLQFHVV